MRSQGDEESSEWFQLGASRKHRYGFTFSPSGTNYAWHPIRNFYTGDVNRILGVFLIFRAIQVESPLYQISSRDRERILLYSIIFSV